MREAIRDKIAASKRKGMWMGGNLPLGYDVKDRQLVVNEGEAQTVRLMFRRYLELGQVPDLLAELRQQGIVSKVWISSKGIRRGGHPYSRGALYYLLRNSLYVGRIAHLGASHPGLHIGIVDQEIWDRVQSTLTENRQGGSRAATSSGRDLLAGLLFDDRGNLMSPSHSRKANGRRYRYYVSQAVLQGRTKNAGTIRRASAEAIESLVERNLRAGLPKAKQMECARLSVEEKRRHIASLVERLLSWLTALRSSWLMSAAISSRWMLHSPD